MTRSGGAKRKKRQKKMRNSELGMRNEGKEAAAATAVAKPVAGSVAGDVAVASVAVPSTEYSVASTEPVEAAAGAPAVVVETKLTASAPPSTLAPPPSAASSESAIRNLQSAILPPHPAKRVRPPAISKITGKRIEAPALKTPEFLREHGLDPADYNGGRSDDPGPVWITGPDPEEVLSRDTSMMNAEEYSQYLKDVAFLKAYGSYREPDRRKSIVMYDNHYYR